MSSDTLPDHLIQSSPNSHNTIWIFYISHHRLILFIQSCFLLIEYVPWKNRPCLFLEQVLTPSRSSVNLCYRNAFELSHTLVFWPSSHHLKPKGFTSGSTGKRRIREAQLTLGLDPQRWRGDSPDLCGRGPCAQSHPAGRSLSYPWHCLSSTLFCGCGRWQVLQGLSDLEIKQSQDWNVCRIWRANLKPSRSGVGQGVSRGKQSPSGSKSPRTRLIEKRVLLLHILLPLASRPADLPVWWQPASTVPEPDWINRGLTLNSYHESSVLLRSAHSRNHLFHSLCNEGVCLQRG